MNKPTQILHAVAYRYPPLTGDSVQKDREALLVREGVYYRMLLNILQLYPSAPPLSAQQRCVCRRTRLSRPTRRDGAYQQLARKVWAILFIFFLLTGYNNCYAQDTMYVAYVQSADSRWQIIDQSGAVLADSLFEHDSLAVLNCSKGMAITEGGGKFGFRNLLDGTIIPNRYDSVTPFHNNGLAAVKSGSAWYCIGMNGTIDARNLTVADLEPYLYPKQENPDCINNYCLVESDSALNCRAPNGTLMLARSDVFVAPWNNVSSFTQNRILKYKVMANKICSCQKLTSYYGFIDRTGKWVIEPAWEEADIFSGGLAAVGEGTEGILTYGYIGTDGEWKIQPVYKEAGRFMRISR